MQDVPLRSLHHTTSSREHAAAAIGNARGAMRYAQTFSVSSHGAYRDQRTDVIADSADHASLAIQNLSDAMRNATPETRPTIMRALARARVRARLLHRQLQTNLDSMAPVRGRIDYATGRALDTAEDTLRFVANYGYRGLSDTGPAERRVDQALRAHSRAVQAGSNHDANQSLDTLAEWIDATRTDDNPPPLPSTLGQLRSQYAVVLARNPSVQSTRQEIGAEDVSTPGLAQQTLRRVPPRLLARALSPLVPRGRFTGTMSHDDDLEYHNVLTSAEEASTAHATFERSPNEASFAAFRFASERAQSLYDVFLTRMTRQGARAIFSVANRQRETRVRADDER